jgi:Histidine kinase
VSTITRFPGLPLPQNTSQDDFEREVAARFGLVPNFFRSAPAAPLVIRELWLFAKSAYLDNPIPTLFKERLFVYLSRFCEVRYCITRHGGFLLGLGRSAGDPDAPVMTVAQVVRLLQRPIPSDEHIGAALARLEAVAEPINWPSPETAYDEDLLTSATVLFLQPARASRAKRALRIALGGEKFELLIAFLTFIRSAHYWTLMHPELALEDDLNKLLREHEQLAQLLLVDSEACRCEMGTRLFEELASLRELNERKALEEAKRALEESGRQKDLLIKEVDHRIKNSLQIVSSLLHMHANTAGPTAGQFHNAAARVAAIAAVHQQLHMSDDVGTVALDQYLVDLCGKSRRHRAAPIKPGRSQSTPTRSSSALILRCHLALSSTNWSRTPFSIRDLRAEAGACGLRSKRGRTVFQSVSPMRATALRCTPTRNRLQSAHE